MYIMIKWDMFSDFLMRGEKIFKLVCGAGNECRHDVERLCTIYSLAGAQVFDICAKPEILAAAKSGLKNAGIKEDRYICISIGIKGDPHISKAVIDRSKCFKCGKCDSVCINNAIKNYSIELSKCIGCARCLNICSAISMKESDIDLKTVLPPLINDGIDCIELHVSSESAVDEKWDIITSNFGGILSICIDRLYLGNKQVIERIKKMIKKRAPYTTIIQADGVPMSGYDDEYKTTLQAVAAAEIIQNAKLPVYIMLSGGTNSKTAQLAKLCSINYKGIAVGSYARKIVSEYIHRDDFYSNETVFNSALYNAKKIVSELTLQTD